MVRLPDSPSTSKLRMVPIEAIRRRLAESMSSPICIYSSILSSTLENCFVVNFTNFLSVWESFITSSWMFVANNWELMQGPTSKYSKKTLETYFSPIFAVEFYVCALWYIALNGDKVKSSPLSWGILFCKGWAVKGVAVAGVLDSRFLVPTPIQLNQAFYFLEMLPDLPEKDEALSYPSASRIKWSCTRQIRIQSSFSPFEVCRMRGEKGIE